MKIPNYSALRCPAQDEQINVVNIEAVEEQVADRSANDELVDKGGDVKEGAAVELVVVVDLGEVAE